MKVIDSHTHLFAPQIIRDRERIGTRDPQFAGIYGNPKARMAQADALIAYMRSESVDKAVICGFPFRDSGLITLMNDYILDTAATHEGLIPFVMVDPTDESAALSEAQRCAARGAGGLGEFAFYSDGFGAGQRRFMDTLATFAAHAGLPILLHVNEQIGHHYPGKAQIVFQEIVRLVENHPTLDLILAHLGGGLCFYEFMPEIKRSFRRVRYDIAAVPFLYSPSVFTFLAQHLAEKILFGSDFPLLSLQRYGEGLNHTDPTARERILYKNAAELLGIKEPP